MDAANTPRTTRDALTIELLGDVGRLHDEIKALPEGLKTALAPALGAIALASKEAQATIGQLGAVEKASFGNFAAAEKVALRDSLKAALREEAGDALASVARELAASAKALDAATKSERRQRWQWIAVAFAGSLLAGALGFYGSHLLYDNRMETEAAFGRAVGTVWDSLDAKTKERIQAARERQ
ncbi:MULTISPECIES: hypothetical protein [unclassified Acidovorax]|uniref:hypothetical protein n=1 Tax=unclassified Acidovorax TaxID=2684926 RepID=UPI002882EC4F|nr:MULTISPECIES: hypothetical protein [unclassified Acidovorax]